MKQYFLIFILVFLNFSFHILAQQQNVDSLFQQIDKQNNDKKKVEALINLSKEDVLNLRPDILYRAIEISNQIYYLEGIAKAYDLMGYRARKQNDFKKSVEYHKRALGFLEHSTDTLTIIKITHNLSVALRKLNFDKEAYRNYINSLKFAKKIKDTVQIARLYNGIGNVYVNTESYDKALYYFRKSYELELLNKNLVGQDYNLANIGEVFLLKNELDSAQNYIERTLSLEKIIYKPDKLGMIYNLMGQLYKRKEDWVRAVHYYRESIPLLQKNNDKRYISNSYINMGVCKIELKKYKLGKEDILKGRSIADSIQSTENVYLANIALSYYYQKKNQYQKALETYKQAIDYHNKIVNQNIKQSILTTQVVYETQEKDNEIKKLALEKEQEKKIAHQTQLRLIYTILISIILLAFIYYSN